MRKVILDVDTGVDDAMGIVLALASPELEVLGITTVNGNVNMHRATKNTLRLLCLVKQNMLDKGLVLPQIFMGEEHPLCADKERANATGVMGSDGFGDLGDERFGELDWSMVSEENAVEWMARVCTEHAQGDVTLVCTGPTTNYARFLHKHPRAASRLRKVVVMGGAVDERGNIPPLSCAEFNVFCDPEALAASLAFTVPVLLVPLDVTHKVMLSAEKLAEVSARATAFHATMGLICAHYLRFITTHHARAAVYLHDPLAVAVALDESLVTLRPMALFVDTREGITRGLTLPNRSGNTLLYPPNVHVAMEVDAARFLTLFNGRVWDGTGKLAWAGK